MSEMLGADVAELRALARDFSGNSQKLAQAQKTLDGAVNQLPRYWQGPDAQRFASQWRGQHRGVISRAAAMLDDAATELKKNAEEQEQTSSAASLTGTGSSGGGGHSGGGGGDGKKPVPQFGPDWLADEDSPFRNGWNAYNWAKLIPNMRAGIFDFSALLTQAGREGMPFRQTLSFLKNSESWNALRGNNAFSQFANMSSDLFDGRWDKALQLAEAGKAAKFFEFAGNSLGVVGVGLDVMDGLNYLADEKYGDAAYSGVKAALGGLSFLPPPAGTAAMVASGALFLYDNVPIIHDTANFVGGKIAEGAGAAVDAVADTGKKVAKFFGF